VRKFFNQTAVISNRVRAFDTLQNRAAGYFSDYLASKKTHDAPFATYTILKATLP